VVRADLAVAPGAPAEIHGAAVRAKQAIGFAQAARLARPALVNGASDVVMAPRTQLRVSSPSSTTLAASASMASARSAG
jgi:hypothetical protein